MSVPHTGRLTARIGHVECQFDGNIWSTPLPLLTDLLNQTTATCPKNHYDIHSLALHVLTKAGLRDQVEILSWTADSWTAGDDIPEGDVD